MMRAWAASLSGAMVWAIIKNPTVSRPSSRASPKCWIDTSASVQWVAIRQIDPPLSRASLMSSLVPTPGNIKNAIRASFAVAAASLISSCSGVFEKP
ncbi:Uncharacterised protein [Mycobacterium tuberculosis]|nr:Uncharacterised protein [Mycobacterium tuberculosis]